MVLLFTVAPSIHTSDSPELASAAMTLGIPHAPGYPLYTLLAHLLTYIPMGDVAFRLNMLSAMTMALCASVLFGLLLPITSDCRIAFGTTLILMWSNSVWSNGIVAEVYALQLLAILIAVTALIDLLYTDDVSAKQVIYIGIVYGVAVAVHPVNVLFAFGFVYAFLFKRVRMSLSVMSGFISVGIFALTLLYFPIRYRANPEINAAGYYDANCIYQTVDLQSVEGVAWHITGRQFDSLFFADGWLPSIRQVGEGLRWFWLNWLGVGVLVGVLGCWRLWRDERNLFWLWLILIVPYTYFFLTYGANDRFAMFVPSYLLWSIPLAFGFRVFTNPSWLRWLSIGVAALMLLINYPLVNLRGNTEQHDRSLLLLENVQPDAVVFGHWHDVVAMQYFQITEQQRHDVRLYNLFFFDDHPHGVDVCIETFLGEERPVIFIGSAHQDFVDMNLYRFQTVFISERYNPPIYLQLITKD